MDKLLQSILKETPDKSEWSTTTSLKFKTDLIDWCGDRFKNKKVLEIGSHNGHTTRILGLLFDEVYTINHNEPGGLFEIKETISEANYYKTYKVNIKNEQNYVFDNVFFIKQNAYHANGLSLDIPEVEVSFIDCLHTREAVIQDINNSIGIGAKTLIFDDYGLIGGVRKGVDETIQEGKIKLDKEIGLKRGSHSVGGTNKSFYKSEGIICSVV